MVTNASSITDALNVVGAVQERGFTTLVTTKQGAIKNGILYGDDTVMSVIVTGFRYDSLVRKSLDQVLAMSDDDLTALVDGKVGMDGRGKSAVEGPVTLADAIAARDELVTSFRDTLDGNNESTTAHVYEPLVIDNESVKGARVYQCVAGTTHKCHCRTCTGDARAPVEGQINLSGLLVGRKVLVPAANGPAPEGKSMRKTVAKDAIRARLPLSRYVTYRLEPQGDWILKSGEEAVSSASSENIVIRDGLVEELAG